VQFDFDTTDETIQKGEYRYVLGVEKNGCFHKWVAKVLVPGVRQVKVQWLYRKEDVPTSSISHSMRDSELLMTVGVKDQDIVLRASIGDKVTVTEGRKSQSADFWYSRIFNSTRKEVTNAPQKPRRLRREKMHVVSKGQ
jgi:hypothetical protein